MTKQDILEYLNNLRKPTTEDPENRWVGTYNGRQMILLKFFKSRMTQFVANLGADEVIDYRTQAFEDLVHDYDAVLDTVGGETYSKSFEVLKREGGIVVSMLEHPNRDLMEQFGVKAMFQFTQVNRERLTKLAQWVDKNSIRVNVDRAFSIDDAAKALDYVKDVHPRGKVVLTMQ